LGEWGDGEQMHGMRRYDGGHSGVVVAISLSRNGNVLLSACSNCIVKVWDVPSYELRYTLGGSDYNTIHRITAIIWSPDGERFAVVFNTCVKFWYVSDCTSANLLVVRNTKRMLWTRDTRLLVTMSSHTTSTNDICIWNDRTYECLLKISHEYGLLYHSFSLSNCGMKIAYSLRTWKEGKIVECCFIASLQESNFGNIMQEIMRKPSEPFSHIDWSPCGEFIATFYSNTVFILIASSLIIKAKRRTRCKTIISSSWTPNGKLYACLSVNKMRVVRNNVAFIDFFNTKTRTSTTETLSCYHNTVNFEWIVDGYRFVTATDDLAVQIWDTNTRTIIHTIGGNSLLLNCFSWIANGDIIAQGGNDRIIIWKTDAQGIECIATIRFRERLIDTERAVILRKCPKCRKELQPPFGYKGYPDNQISCCICYEECNPIMMTICGHFLCEICFRNPMVFGFSGANVIDDLANSMMGVSLSPREDEYVPYDMFLDVFVVYGRYPNPPESRDRNETVRRKDVIIEVLRRHSREPIQNRVSAQVVMDITFYCDPPRVDYPLGFMSPDEQSTQSFRRSVCMVADIPDWQCAIISLYLDLMRRN